MRPLLLVGLAACWSPPAASKPAPTTVAGEPRPAPAAAPARTYVLPSQIVEALATEPLAGNVLVPWGVTLQATLVAARGETEQPGTGTPHAMKVVRDHGDVVEVSTAPAQDCAEDYDQPYQLTVFVKRAKLVPRSNVEITRTFGDGTAVAIDRGAPVAISDTGPRWHFLALSETSVAPNALALTYAVPAASTAAALPKSTGDRLVCHEDAMLTLTEYKAARRQDRVDEARREEARRRAQDEAARAERERKQREAEATKPKRKKPMTEAEKLADLLAASSGFSGGSALESMSSRPLSLEMNDAERFAPYCGVSDPSDAYPTPTTTTPKPTIDGKPVSWPRYAHRRQNHHVVAAGTKYLADVHYTCGRVRMLVERAGVGTTGGALGTGMGGAQIRVRVPGPGPVTWLDGTPAGTYSGHKRYKDVVEQGDRICVRVKGIAERVCHPKKTATTELSSPYRAE